MLPIPRRFRQNYLCRQGQKPETPRQLLLQQGAADTENAPVGGTYPRHPLCSGENGRGRTPARKQPHQALQTALQRAAEGRQDVSLHRRHQGIPAAHLQNTTPQRTGRHLLRSLQPRADNVRLARPLRRTLPSTALPHADDGRRGGRGALQGVPRLPHTPLPCPLHRTTVARRLHALHRGLQRHSARQNSGSGQPFTRRNGAVGRGNAIRGSPGGEATLRLGGELPRQKRGRLRRGLRHRRVSHRKRRTRGLHQLLARHPRLHQPGFHL